MFKVSRRHACSSWFVWTALKISVAPITEEGHICFSLGDPVDTPHSFAHCLSCSSFWHRTIILDYADIIDDEYQNTGVRGWCRIEIGARREILVEIVANVQDEMTWRISDSLLCW